MKNLILSFFTGTRPFSSKIENTAWLLFSLHLGLSMAIGAGLPKIVGIAPPEWFVNQVSDLGFHFPSPVFWAAMAAWGEFLGGILIAIGLFTRFAALQLAFQFFVISFIWYKNPVPVAGMYIQQLFFWCYIWIMVKGGGQYSLDRLLEKRKKINIRPALVMGCCLLFIGMGTMAQERKPLVGSGKIITLQPEAKDFDKINIEGMNGQVFIQLGESFSVNVEVDDNLASLVKTRTVNGKFFLELEGNRYNKLYVENTNIKVRIQMPEISVLEYEGNGKVAVSNMTGRYFRLIRQGNADLTINGRVDECELFTDGNGNVDASALIVQHLKLRKSGNGDVKINIDKPFLVQGAGNGDVINLGQGRANAVSVLVGNGKMRYPNQETEKKINNDSASEKIQVVLRNTTDKDVHFTVAYPVKGTYGIEVKAGEDLVEYFPVGTRLYKGNPYTRKLKKPVFVIGRNSANAPLLIQ